MTITLTVPTNTYVTLADADAYHTIYANADWTGNTDDEARKQALILATQSVDLLYGAKYLSIIASETQSLLFPRSAFTDNNGRYVTSIPTALKNAVCEIALLNLNGTNIFPIANTANNVKSETLQVGGVSISTQNYRANESETFEGFRKVDILLRAVLKQVPTSFRIRA